MKKILSLMMFFLLVFSVVGCSKKDNTYGDVQGNKAVEKEFVKIVGLKGPTSIGMIKMFEEKPFLGENLDSSYEIAGSPDILVSKLLSKEVDFAALPTNVAAKLYNKEAGYEMAAINTWGVLYVMTQGETIKTWEDLKGKKINAIAKGSTPDVAFRYLLEKNGLDPEKDVTLDYTFNHVELAQAMIAGKVNIAVLPEPFVTMVSMKNKEATVAMNIQEEWENALGENAAIAQGCLVVRKDFAQKHPDAVKNFLDEYEKSINWVNENKEEAGKLIEKHGIGMKAKIAELAIPRCNIAFKDAQNAKETVQKYLKVLYDFSPKDVGGKLPDENFYYNQQ
ncbi:ABC transporter substrate-binding protein [Marinisporobacter balticus]|uniref:NitT/TauT family transport system substrate-binding protein n=1 Tax=Marinisporobacter balticus TaxID=2018667 RepID=A0A4R2LH51_9FIRM|nr:ABC transporter substrate-binding protein [Marinisporobacter balticus]TCO78655.1 NitT/TauT family transport system substrate-binding protein [Marinisporobacter balticus]